jgi:plasmid stabilization system protein ParE
MPIRWTSKAQSDLLRLYEFLAPVNRRAAARAVQELRAAPGQLLRDNPRIGSRLQEFAPREVRRLFVGDYELRYEIQDQIIIVLRLWHTREDR